MAIRWRRQRLMPRITASTASTLTMRTPTAGTTDSILAADDRPRRLRCRTGARRCSGRSRRRTLLRGRRPAGAARGRDLRRRAARAPARRSRHRAGADRMRHAGDGGRLRLPQLFHSRRHQGAGAGDHRRHRDPDQGRAHHRHRSAVEQGDGSAGDRGERRAAGATAGGAGGAAGARHRGCSARRASGAHDACRSRRQVRRSQPSTAARRLAASPSGCAPSPFVPTATI